MGSTEKVTTGLEMAAEDAGAGRFGQGTILNRVAARAYRRTPDQPCADCLDHALAVPVLPGRHLALPTARWAAAGARR
jgi:hypothetical protein